MTEPDRRSIIATNWGAKSREALLAAEAMFAQKLLISCVNRMYYSVFYSVSAALALDGKEYGRHTAVRAALHRDFVRPGRIPLEMGKVYDRLLEDREEGDYTPETLFSEEDVRDLLRQTKGFVLLFEAMLNQAPGSDPGSQR